jgi:hexosaminidase
VRIEDKPRFAWRGLMLDVARHFFNKAEVKNFIDLLAQHKMNTFHWHLVDDQGWRIEIKAYPKLTQVGAWRSGIGFGLDPKATTAYGPDGRYGGFFTQDDVREVLAYAKDRYITIVPEIEMPGHAVAALAAYPQYSCTGGPYSTDIVAGVHLGVYCAGNDATFQFLDGILGEVVDLFPSKYIHIGGDEVPKDNWKKCPKCQARMKREGLKTEHELQSYFVKRVEKLLNARSRALIGWDEILEGGLAPNATVMSWRGIKGGIAAAKSGHDVVMTPTSHCYIDYYQAPPAGEPKAIGGFVPLAKVYSFDPVPPELAGANAKHVLGADANLWSEYFPNYAHVQYMAYPRACALAELTWSEAKAKDWDGFSARLNGHLARLKVQNVNYRQPRPGDNTPPPPQKKTAGGKKKK